MTQDEIIEMAAQAELLDANWMPEELMAFAKLVAAKEREACAKECEAGVDMWPGEFHEEWNDACNDRASAIRART
jgi:hypothetical protein